MDMKHRLKSLTIPALSAALLLGCQSAPSTSDSPSATTSTSSKTTTSPARTRNNAELEKVRLAYETYLNDADIDEGARLDALSRLAEIEYQLQGGSAKDDSNGANETPQERAQRQRLERTIQLLATATRDYPDAKENQTLLYQLAKAYAENGQHRESIDALIKLSEKFTQSPFYAEAQFRVAEDAFSRQDYSAAEYAYSEVLIAEDNRVFYEKALFKRGWARFKQQYYNDALDDFIESIAHHGFARIETLDAAEKDQFDEYYRSLALTYAYQGDRPYFVEQIKRLKDHAFIYHAYRVISEQLLQQERFSDAVDTQQAFLKDFPKSDYQPYAHLKTIDIWKDSGFNQKIYQAIESFYTNYNPASAYWKNQNEDSKVNRRIRRELRDYVVLMATYYHQRYQKRKTKAELANAEKWYRRYLTHYSAYAMKDGMHFAYAELLTQDKRIDEALKYYELAAYDDSIILNPKAAYATVSLSDQLFKKTKKPDYLERLLDYSRRYSQQVGKDPRSARVALHGAEVAFQNKHYQQCIELGDIAKSKGWGSYYLDGLIAASYFNLEEFEAAEQLYTKVLLDKKLGVTKRKEYRDKLGVSIYRQGEASQNQQDINRAIYHFARISQTAPRAKSAATGLYDAIALNIQHQQWNSAIDQIERFQKLYPRHQFSADVSKKLSLAYLKSNQGIKAAQAFEKISQLDSDREVQAAALWQAAELYEQKNKRYEAIKAYRNYFDKFKKPYTQSLEAIHKVAGLYLKIDKPKSQVQWLSKLVKLDGKTLNNQKTDRSRYLVSQSYLTLARLEHQRFERIQLKQPIKRNLLNKKKAMQSAVKFYAQAAADKIYESATESTFQIGKIYKDFSKSLLDSERPKNLNEEELDQYEILLEDQALPFEDKAIEFFEINLARIKDGHFNDWIGQSHEALKVVFPVRYDREPKQDDYIREMD